MPDNQSTNNQQTAQATDSTGIITNSTTNLTPEQQQQLNAIPVQPTLTTQSANLTLGDVTEAPPLQTDEQVARQQQQVPYQQPQYNPNQVHTQPPTQYQVPPQQPQVPQQQQAPQQQQFPYQQQQYNTAPVITQGQPTQPPAAQDQEFVQRLKQHYNITPEQLDQGLRDYQQLQVEVGMQHLEQLWQVPRNTVEQRLNILANEISQMDPQQAALYDTVKGAEFLWYQVQGKYTQPVAPQMPSQTALVQPGAAAYKFTESQIQNMPEHERARRDIEIQHAYLNNQVLNDTGV